MKQKKEALVLKKLILFSLLLTISIIPLVYAGFFDQAKALITGRQSAQPANLTLVIGNTAPVIDVVEIDTTQQITEGGASTIVFNFTATDLDLVANLDPATARGQFNKTGNPLRPVPPATCIFLENVNTTTDKFQCSIDILYFDEPGDWTVNVSISDDFGEYAEDLQTTFTLASTSSITISPSALTWPTLAVTSINVLSNNDPIVINNTGNQAGSSPAIQMQAFDIPGETTTPVEFLLAGNFTVNIADACEGDPMANATIISITSSDLPRGQNSLENIFFCLEEISAGIGQQTYSSSNETYGNAWVVGFI